mgnify:CR=1 FL=1
MFSPFCPVDIRVLNRTEGIQAVRDMLSGQKHRLLALVPRQLCGPLALSPFFTALQGDGHAVQLMTAIPANPSVSELRALLDELRRTAFIPTVILAIGGGSCMDLAKGASALLHLPAQSTATDDGVRAVIRERAYAQEHPFVDIIAMPTTAGTGSEVTLVAVVADTHKHAKLSFTSYKLVPHAAILDPALTATLPPKLTATTGMDALTHAVEAYTSIQKNPVSDAFAVKAIELIAANLPRACEQGDDVEARTNLALASLMAGAAFSNAMVGIVHAIGHSLGGLCHVPHGQAMMMLLPHCVRWNIDHGVHAGLYGELLGYLDPTRNAQLANAPAAERDQAVCEALFALNKSFHEKHGVPLTLRELGIEHDQLEAVAKQARYDGAALYNATEVTIEDAMEILEAVY